MRLTYLFLGLAIAIGLNFYKSNRSQVPDPHRLDPEPTKRTTRAARKLNTSKQKEVSAPERSPAGRPSGEKIDAKSAKSAELASLTEMTRTLADAAASEANVSDLVKTLSSSRQEPFVTRDANDFTGEMVIVRTKSPLPGTRYFHAQYFADETNTPFVQHMSFEYKPGPHAMEEAIAAVRTSFPTLGDPKTKTDDFAMWNLDQHRIVWVKKMGAEDLKDDPFNAYTKADLNTIRVAIEPEIHDSADERESGFSEPLVSPFGSAARDFLAR